MLGGSERHSTDKIKQSWGSYCNSRANTIDRINVGPVYFWKAALCWNFSFLYVSVFTFMLRQHCALWHTWLGLGKDQFWLKRPSFVTTKTAGNSPGKCPTRHEKDQVCWLYWSPTVVGSRLDQVSCHHQPVYLLRKSTQLSIIRIVEMYKSNINA